MLLTGCSATLEGRHSKDREGQLSMAGSSGHSGVIRIRARTIQALSIMALATTARFIRVHIIQALTSQAIIRVVTRAIIRVIVTIPHVVQTHSRLHWIAETFVIAWTDLSDFLTSYFLHAGN